ncbi:TetR/AcrR family transcriptional regulator [Haliea sp. E17]|uniref:TetR/AcrR family transcriptional regulator n=1 Tax=Haliea sp. E17 TaxID=3401576 RepID=UPI003AAA36D7
MVDNLSSFSTPQPPRTKGQRTAARILDVAEEMFAHQGFAGTSLRQIADGAGIREPGLYNHFAGKQELYDAVLRRALSPITTAINLRLDGASGLPDYTDLPSLVSDLLIERPQRAALLQQALAGGHPGLATHYQGWLESVFQRGVEGINELGLGREIDRHTLVLNLLAILSLVTGYVQSAGQFRLLGCGEIDDPENVARHKLLLRRIIRAMLIS